MTSTTVLRGTTPTLLPPRERGRAGKSSLPSPVRINASRSSGGGAGGRRPWSSSSSPANRDGAASPNSSAASGITPIAISPSPPSGAESASSFASARSNQENLSPNKGSSGGISGGGARSPLPSSSSSSVRYDFGNTSSWTAFGPQGDTKGGKGRGRRSHGQSATSPTFVSTTAGSFEVEAFEAVISPSRTAQRFVTDSFAPPFSPRSARGRDDIEMTPTLSPAKRNENDDLGWTREPIEPIIGISPMQPLPPSSAGGTSRGETSGSASETELFNPNSNHNLSASAGGGVGDGTSGGGGISRSLKGMPPRPLRLTLQGGLGGGAPRPPRPGHPEGVGKSSPITLPPGGGGASVLSPTTASKGGVNIRASTQEQRGRRGRSATPRSRSESRSNTSSRSSSRSRSATAGATYGSDGESVRRAARKSRSQSRTGGSKTGGRAGDIPPAPSRERSRSSTRRPLERGRRPTALSSTLSTPLPSPPGRGRSTSRASPVASSPIPTSRGRSEKNLKSASPAPRRGRARSSSRNRGGALPQQLPVISPGGLGSQKGSGGGGGRRGRSSSRTRGSPRTRDSSRTRGSSLAGDSRTRTVPSSSGEMSSGVSSNGGPGRRRTRSRSINRQAASPVPSLFSDPVPASSSVVSGTSSSATLGHNGGGGDGHHQVQRGGGPPRGPSDRAPLHPTGGGGGRMSPGLLNLETVPSSGSASLASMDTNSPGMRGTSEGVVGARKNSSLSNLKEKLFGDSVSAEARRSYLPPRTPQGSLSATSLNTVGSSDRSATQPDRSAAQPEAVYTRTLLTASVYHNQATDLWITTINTNQKPSATNKSNAARYLKAFSFFTEREARESAYANAPPRMTPFSECPNCFICRGRFAVFRRSSHCRNCGVSVCGSCSTSWSARMIPETYNVKKAKSVKICKSCNFLAGAFRHALLEGQYDEAIALYNTGNINLRCPFMNVKGGGEIMFPIHCAANGGNLDLLRWLVDVHHCPIKLVRTGNKHREGVVDDPIVTSKGRSILNIAMSGEKVDTLRYLIIEKGMSVYEIKDLKTSLRALEVVLNAFPHDYEDLSVNDLGNLNIDSDMMVQQSGGSMHSHYESTDGDGSSDADVEDVGDHSDDESVETTAADACILCCDNSIDCVITPCGHQICCLECSRNLRTCPVCNAEGQFIRIFKP